MASFTQPGSSSHHAAYEAFQSYANPSGSSAYGQQQFPPPQFDIIDWYPNFQSCHRYFLDHAQHSSPVQALAAFINIRLPYQKHPNPVLSSSSSSPRSAGQLPQFSPFGAAIQPGGNAHCVSLIPYIRRLIVTGHDRHSILHGFFGDDWVKGVGPLHEIERRNYLFAAKSQAWLKVKQHYDMSLDETCPFLKPLSDVSDAEIQAAESAWSDWLAMEDWMLGPRAPENLTRGVSSPHVKREPHD
ncbi:hypothetical protein B0O99DRAFT_99274 [Bisporella sp. PMI_857]|nr:hypothetical protein B0O99DRAFT_99274 [Bisporella sp. PMI_857]